jgi:hypothetical protein
MCSIKRGNNRKVSVINKGSVDYGHILTSVDFKFIYINISVIMKLPQKLLYS